MDFPVWWVSAILLPFDILNLFKAIQCDLSSLCQKQCSWSGFQQITLPIPIHRLCLYQWLKIRFFWCLKFQSKTFVHARNNCTYMYVVIFEGGLLGFSYTYCRRLLKYFGSGMHLFCLCYHCEYLLTNCTFFTCLLSSSAYNFGFWIHSPDNCNR